MAVPPFPVEQNYPDTIAGKPMKTYIDWIAPTFVLSLTGLPVASVPCGLDSGMPVGLQVVARPSGEEAALALAAQIERRHPLGVPQITGKSSVAGGQARTGQSSHADAPKASHKRAETLEEERNELSEASAACERCRETRGGCVS